MSPLSLLTSDPRAAILGPIILGNACNIALLGVLLVQSRTYFDKTTREHRVLRALICAILLLELVHTGVLLNHAWWLRLVLLRAGSRPNPIDASYIASSAALVSLSCWLSQIVAALVQTIYARRLWSLSMSTKSRGVAATVVLFATIRLFPAALNILTIRLPPGQPRPDPLSTLMLRYFLRTDTPVWSAGDLPTDILLTTSLALILHNNAKPPSRLNNIAALSQTAAFPLIGVCVDVFLTLYFPFTNYHFVSTFVLGKLYSNSLLRTLIITATSSPPSHPTV